MNDYLIIEENLRAAMRFFGEASGSGEVCALDGSVAMFSGLDYGVFNIGLLTRPAVDGELETRLAEQARYFRQRTLRWSFWLCDDLLDPVARKRERHTFATFGMRAISDPPGMVADALLPPVRPLPAVECLPVRDAAARSIFAELTAVSFDIPYTVAHTVYSRPEAWLGDYQGFVGVLDGRAVAIVAIVPTESALGVYSLATTPSLRRQGYGEALLRAAVAHMQQRTGVSRLVLQSTEAGHAMYRRMGFRDATKFTVYLTR